MIRTRRELRESMKERGNHFLDRKTMAFFGSKVEAGPFPISVGCVFVTSETAWGEERKSYGITIYNDSTGKSKRHKNERDTLGRYRALAGARLVASVLAYDINERNHDAC